MERTRLIEALIDVRHQRGLEIGALDRPAVTRAMGPVEYVDRAPRAELARYYQGHDVDTSRIVEQSADAGDTAVVRAQAEVALARAAAIENSTIWRMTAPLRRAARTFRHRR